jgi:hypothetical protein
MPCSTIKGRRTPCGAPEQEQASRAGAQEQHLARVSGKAPIADAIRYALRHWMAPAPPAIAVIFFMVRINTLTPSPSKLLSVG